jgi:excisionase family DNA binding protein
MENKIFKNQIEGEEWLTSSQASVYLGISSKTLMNLTSNGKIPYYKFGRRNRYLKDELRMLLMSQRRGAL